MRRTPIALVTLPTSMHGDGSDSQAFRCIMMLLGRSTQADCVNATNANQRAEKEQAQPVMSALTIDLTGHLTNDQSISHTLAIDTSAHSLFYFSWLTGTVSVTLTQPNGHVITPAFAEANPQIVTYTAGLGGPGTPPYAAYAVTTTFPGLYTLTVSAGSVGMAGLFQLRSVCGS